MTYRQSSTQGVRLRFKRRVRIPPQYGPPTRDDHMFQQSMRRMIEIFLQPNSFVSNLFQAQDGAFMDGTSWSPGSAGSIKIMHPYGQSQSVPINRIKP